MDALSETYLLHPALDRKKTFTYVPLPADVMELPPIAEETLLEKFAVVCNLDREQLEKHCADTYKQKKILIHGLHILFCRLNGDLDKVLGPLSGSEKEMLILYITEDIDQCTPGFHSRINYLLQSLCSPQTLLGHLSKLRRDLVHAVAYAFASENASEIMHIHAFNAVVKLANADGLGIEPILSMDPYLFDVPLSIRGCLQKILSEALHPLVLPLALTRQLKECLFQLGYHGPCITGEDYSWYYQEFLDLIFQATNRQKKIDLSKNTSVLKKYFIIDEIDDTQFIRDIKWQTVHRYFFSALCNAGIIDRKRLGADTFFDWVLLAYYCPEQPLSLCVIKHKNTPWDKMDEIFPQKSRDLLSQPVVEGRWIVLLYYYSSGALICRGKGASFPYRAKRRLSFSGCSGNPSLLPGR